MFLTIFGALTPPHHWDALTYHLAAPRYFLETGWIRPIPRIEWSNLPLTAELLYGVGLAFGAAAALVAFPWYIKHLILLGSPVSLLLYGGKDFSGSALELMNYYGAQHGAQPSNRGGLPHPPDARVRDRRL